MNIEMRPVYGSTMIKNDGYDEATQTLAIQFDNGKTYQYRGVDPKTFSDYDLAESKGKFLSRVIKPNIQGVEV